MEWTKTMDVPGVLFEIVPQAQRFMVWKYGKSSVLAFFVANLETSIVKSLWPHAWSRCHKARQIRNNESFSVDNFHNSGAAFSAWWWLYLMTVRLGGYLTKTAMGVNTSGYPILSGFHARELGNSATDQQNPHNPYLLFMWLIFCRFESGQSISFIRRW